jgi:hypothetical protein
MKHSRIIQIPDAALNEKLIPANDNYKPTSLSMENFEAGSILSQRDYTKPSRRNQIGLIVSAAVCVLVIAVAFVLPLLK